MSMPTLYQFFHRQVQRGFSERGLADTGTVDYVSDLLDRFARTAALYPMTDADGRPLERIAQFVMESERARGTGSSPPDPSRHALLMRHLGEYTLFMSGLFRERIAARGQLPYYVDHGRGAYWASADFENNPARARLFRRLYADFDRISGALDYIRRVHFPLKTDARECNSPLVALWRT